MKAALQAELPPAGDLDFGCFPCQALIHRQGQGTSTGICGWFTLPSVGLARMLTDLTPFCLPVTVFAPCPLPVKHFHL